jgi:hypothetical protein
MPNANIHDRQSIARIYPPSAFAEDAYGNDRAKPQVLKGVRIAAAPDPDGNFVLERAALHAGEAPGATFLAPFHRATATEDAAADPDPEKGYAAFVDEIIENARRCGFRPQSSPGPADPRLRGLRQ